MKITIKKIFIFILFLGTILIIYYTNRQNKITYVSLGDNLAMGENPYQEKSYGYGNNIKDYLTSKNINVNYIDNFTQKDYTIAELHKDLNINIVKIVNNKKMGIKRALTSSDVVTLSIGTTDLLNIINSKDSKLKKLEDINYLFSRYNDLIIDLKKYAQQDVLVLNYYFQDGNDYIVYANNLLQKIANDNELIYIDTYKIFNNNYKKYLPNPHSIYPNDIGYNQISSQIIKKLKK